MYKIDSHFHTFFNDGLICWLFVNQMKTEPKYYAKKGSGSYQNNWQQKRARLEILILKF